ncbi:aspartyl-phosphate phosphatase Spo0E family protein [Paraliobacillus salinarum]|uniref:aspartyl-phosphate phosphatase Spo0E family protein n=1 Tax=Paraliobacillus salinarum TaxID=1158996 RepID=UPI001C70DD99|nr:aspartyl-phosphate phosphatase Spo0E family protein [Paraliobacillus salinarum]
MVRIIPFLQENNNKLKQSDKEKLEKIEELRHQMYQHFDNTQNKQDIVAISQELDKLIYDYIASTNKRCK